MNIQIINISKTDKFADKLKHLSIPSSLYYNIDNSVIDNLLNEFICNKHECCIDVNTYKNLINNLKPNNKDLKIYNVKKLTRNNTKKLNNRKTRKNKN